MRVSDLCGGDGCGFLGSAGEVTMRQSSERGGGGSGAETRVRAYEAGDEAGTSWRRHDGYVLEKADKVSIE